MNTPAYDKDITALLVVDPYNDFISEGGKIWPRIKAVAKRTTASPTCWRFSTPRAGQSSASSMPCIIATALATMRRGNTLRPFRKEHGNTGASNSAHGVASFAPSSCLSLVKL